MSNRMQLEGSHIAIVLRGVVDERAKKTATVLAKAGARVTICAFTWQRGYTQDKLFKVCYFDPEEPRPSRFKNRLLRIATNLTLKRTQKIITVMREGAFGTNLIRRVLLILKPDAVCAVNADTLAGVAQAAQKMDIPFLYEAYEYWPEHALERACLLTTKERTALLENEKNYISWAKALVTVSPSIAASYQSHYGLDRMPSIVFNAPTEIVHEPSHVHKPLQLVFSGNLQPERNIGAFAQAVIETNGFNLTFLGNGTMKKELEALAQGAGKDKIFVKPPVKHEELLETLKQYDAGVICHIPYNKQMDGALPNKYFESIASGLAILASDTSAFRSIEALPKFGFLINPSTSATIAASLVDIIDSRPDWDSLKREALIEARNWCGPAVSDGIIKIYKEL